MASPFQKYQQGGFEIPNIAQAGANIGQMYQQGLSDMGRSLGKGIEGYMDGMAKNEAADVKLAGAIKNASMMAEAIGMNPEHADIAEGIAAKLQGYNKVSGKGLNAKLVALHDIETSAQTANLVIAQRANAQQAMAIRAYNETPTSKKVMGIETLLELGYTPGQGNTINRALGMAIRKAHEANAFNKAVPGDAGYNEPNDVLNNLLGNARVQISEALKADPKNAQLLNADKEISGAIQQFQAAFGADAALRAGAKDISQFAKQATEGFTEREAAEAGMRPPESLAGRATQAEKSLKDAQDGLKATQDRLARGDFVDQPVTETVVSAGKAIGGGLSSILQNRYTMQGLARGLKTFEAIKGNGVEITPDVAKELVAANTDFGKSLGGFSLVAGGINHIVSLINPIETLTAREKQNIADAMKERFADKPGVKDVGTFNARETLEQNQKVYQQQIDTAKQETANIETERKKFEEKRLTATVEGNVVRERPLSATERVEIAKESLARSDYVKNRFGGKIPTAALEALQSRIMKAPQVYTDPETGASFFDRGDGQFQQVKESEKKGSSLAVNRPLFNPNSTAIREGRTSQYVIEGNFSGDEQKFSEFQKTNQDRVEALNIVERLNEINEMPFESLSPTLKTEADTLVYQLVGKNRVDFIGPGNVAIPEWEILLKIVSNPTRFFELDSSTRAGLKVLKNRVLDGMENDAYSKGVTIRRATSGAEVGREARLNNLINR